MFGKGDEPGVLGRRGAPRWKQRALYDAIKDTFAIAGGRFRVVRLAVYDEVAGIQLGAALKGGTALDSRALMALVKQRTVGAES